MTIKELVTFTGKTERTIRTWINKAGLNGCEKTSQGYAIDYSVDEVEYILNAGSMSKDAVRILMENARKPVQSLEMVSAPNQMDVLFAFMERQQQSNQEFMKTVLSELKGIKKQPLQIESTIKEDFYSLAAYCAINGMKINRSEMAIHGRELKKICGNYGSEIHSIPDERWGKVNSYPVEILEEYFSV